MSSRRLTIQWLIIFTLLAWATQTLLAQWGFGQITVNVQPPEFSTEKFLGGDGLRPVTIELRDEASVSGGEIRLRQVARWSGADDVTLRSSGDLVVARFEGSAQSATIDLDVLRSTMESAGLNLTSIHFRGAVSCRVSRVDAPPTLAAEGSGTRPAAPPANAARSSSSSWTPPVAEQAASDAPSTPRTLREILIADVAERLSLPAESLQVRFNQADEKLANLREPQFRFDIECRRPRSLGDLTWDLVITSDASRQKTSISANVRAWQTQLSVARPMAFRQTFGEDDVVERRVLMDRLGDGPMLKREQVIGQQAALDISPGAVLTPRMIEAPQLVRVGDLVTVFVEQGRIRLKWVAEARENGALGQSIRVRKPQTREEFKVVVTGPQQGRLSGAVSNATRIAAAP